MSDTNGPPDRVVGERDRTMAARVRSLQARMGNLLAIGLMSAMGLGALTWYYAHALTRGDRARVAEQAAAAKRAQGDAPLPSLGRIDPAPFPAAEPQPSADPPPLPPQSLLEIPVPPAPGVQPLPAVPPAAGPREKTPAELALDRQLGGVVWSTPVPGHAVVRETEPDAPGLAESAGPVESAGPDVRRSSADLAGMLQPTAMIAARARLLPARRLLLPKGAFVDCTLETAIDSSLPGMATCVTATDTFGADGSVVLMERGTKLVGETRGEVAAGGSRIFVVWTEARTPTGVVVPLDSPAADELGRSGLSGEVDRHFWQRFGAAILVSVIEGAVDAASQSSHSGGEVIVNPSASQSVLTEILRSTINIPPTVVKRNGDRIQVLVARDLDFRSVYELRPVASGR